MRRLPTTKTKKQETIIRAVADFFNKPFFERDVINTSLALMNRRVELTEEQKDAVWYVRENLTDKRYCESLLV